MNTTNEKRTTTDQLASRMHETVDRVAETARNAEHHIRARASELGDNARETEERALKALEGNLRKAKSYVQENPLMSAGIAFATGVILSSLLTRR
jgi:ElaB/YqjD/DUF883 family membrane-anchored ribosome-binding protein